MNTLLEHTEFLIYQHPQALVLRVILNPLIAQPIFMFKIALTQVQGIALGFHEIHFGLPLEPVTVPLEHPFIHSSAQILAVSRH